MKPEEKNILYELFNVQRRAEVVAENLQSGFFCGHYTADKQQEYEDAQIQMEIVVDYLQKAGKWIRKLMELVE